MLSHMQPIDPNFIIFSFETLLHTATPAEIEVMWNKYPLLQAWYTGQAVNFGSDDEPDLKSISKDNLVTSFKTILHSKCNDVIIPVWNQNPFLQAWFTGQPVEGCSTSAADIYSIPFIVLLASFKTVLESHCETVIEAIWKENVLLRNWVSGVAVNFGNRVAPFLQTITLQNLVDVFNVALKSQCQFIIEAIWNANLSLRNWLSGRPVNIGSLDVPSFVTIPFSQLLQTYKNVMFSQHGDLVILLWEENASLRNWYTSKIVDISNSIPANFQTIPFEELILSFKSALSTIPSHHVANAMWNENLVLKYWFTSRPVSVPNAKEPNIQIISIEELLNEFKLALSSQASYIAAEMWEGNPRLKAWFSGKAVDFSKLTRPDIRTISFDDLVAAFRMVLASNNTAIIKFFWKENIILKDWYLGLEVNIGNQSAPIMKAISFPELLSHFRSALDSSCKSITQEIWDNNRQLKNWYLGQAMNVGTQAAPVMQQITFHELTSVFQSLLSSKCSHIFSTIWNGHANLQQWFCGHAINIGTENEPQLLKITFEELINHFRAALNSPYKDFAQQVWNANSMLADWFGGRPVNVGTDELPSIKVISFDELFNNFRFVVYSGNETMMLLFWENNSQLRAWYTQQPVNLGSAASPNDQVISLKSLLVQFHFILLSNCHKFSYAIWHNNAALQQWVYGQSVITNSDHKSETISIHEQVENFKKVLESRIELLAEDIWNNTPVLRSWCSGEPVNVGPTTAPTKVIISLDMLTAFFQSVLSSQLSSIIRKVWEGNFMLRAWFRGELVNYGTANEPHQRGIPAETLLKNFNAALESRCPYIINAMWHENLILQQHLQTLNHSAAVALLKKVLSCDHSKKSEFVKLYLTTVTNKNVLINLLKEIQQGKVSGKDNDTNETLLIERLNACSAFSSATSVAPRKAAPKKHKKRTSSVQAQAHTKKAKQTAAEHDLYALAKQLPPVNELDSDHCIYIDLELGKSIQELPSNLLELMGIRFARKIKHQATVRVRIFDSDAYQQFLNKFCLLSPNEHLSGEPNPMAEQPLVENALVNDPPTELVSPPVEATVNPLSGAGSLDGVAHAEILSAEFPDILPLPEVKEDALITTHYFAVNSPITFFGNANSDSTERTLETESVDQPDMNEMIGVIDLTNV